MAQRWRSDNCPGFPREGCIVDEEVIGGVVTMTGVVQKCSAHAAIPDDQLYNVLVAVECRRRRDIEHELRTNTNIGIGELSPSGAWEFKQGITVSWLFVGTGADRVLQVTIAGASLSNQKKTAIQNWCDTNIGAGKVTLIYV